MVGFGGLAEFEEGGVEVLGDGGGGALLIGRDRAGPAGDGRDADAAFVEGAFFGAEGMV